MELHQLRYFLAVADHGGVTGAASALGVTGPTVSTAVRALERDLGTALFERMGRGMLPTSAGHALVGPARRTLRGVSAAADAVHEKDDGLRGSLEIHTLAALGIGTLPFLVAEYRRRFPEVTVHLGRLADETRTRSVLSNGTCELVMTQLPFDAEYPRTPDQHPLAALQLGTQEFWIAFPPDADVPEHDPIAWSEVPDGPFVVVPPGDRYTALLARRLATHGVTPRPAVILRNREARMSFVLAGVGAAFLERTLAGLARSRGARVRALAPPELRAFGLVFEPTGLSPAAAAFVALAREHGQVPADDLATSTKAAAAGDS